MASEMEGRVHVELHRNETCGSALHHGKYHSHRNNTGMTDSREWHGISYSDKMTEGGKDTEYIDKGESLDCSTV